VDYILRSFIPRLRAEGFSEENTQQLLVKNAAAAFAFAPGTADQATSNSKA
jgi:predicted metal-dependent phosphotriesterase family hydrolase